MASVNCLQWLDLKIEGMTKFASFLWRKKGKKDELYYLLALSMNGYFRSSSDRTFLAPGTGEIRGIDEPMCWSVVGDFEDYD